MKLNHLIIIGALCGALLLPSSASSWGVVGLSSGGGGDYEIDDDFSSDTTANYTAISGDSTLSVSGGALHGSSYGNGRFFHETELSSVNHYAQADIVFGADRDSTSLIVRADGTTGATADGYVVKCLTDSPYYVALYRCVNGEDTYLADSSGVGGLTLGTTYSMYVSANTNGSQVDIVVKINTVTVISYSDTNAARLTSGSYIGFLMKRDRNNNDVTVDNLIGDAL